MDVHVKTTELGDGVWGINDSGVVQCYLIVGESSAVLFDCGMNGGQAIKDVVDALTDKPVQVVFSHADNDHTGAVEFFGTPLLHPAEFDYYAVRRGHDKPVLPLWEGDELDLGGTVLEVILTPGHTPGHIALLDRAHRRLFSGDTISDAQVFMFGPGRNIPAYISTLIKLESFADAIDAIHPGHGSMALAPDWIVRTRIAAEKLLSGELDGMAPPRDMPCQLYSFDGVNLLYAPGD